jgi:hypothetical protein
MSDWQPIETAPKDGTNVLVLWRYGGCSVLFCRHDGFWDDGDFNSSIPESDLTHWMPLPPPPTNSTPTKGE